MKNLFQTILLILTFNALAISQELDSLTHEELIHTNQIIKINCLQDTLVLATADSLDDSTKEILVVIKFCANQLGGVISAIHLPEKSNTRNQRFIKLAIDNTYKYKFDPSTKPVQCGEIKYKFRTAEVNNN